MTHAPIANVTSQLSRLNDPNTNQTIFVLNGSEKLSFGELAADAEKLTPPAEIALKKSDGNEYCYQYQGRCDNGEPDLFGAPVRRQQRWLVVGMNAPYNIF